MAAKDKRVLIIVEVKWSGEKHKFWFGYWGRNG